MDAATGELSFRGSAVGREHQLLQFFVRAEDGGRPPLATQVPVDVLVLGPHDRPPVFERTSSKYFVSEAAPVGTWLFFCLFLLLLLLLLVILFCLCSFSSFSSSSSSGSCSSYSSSISSPFSSSFSYVSSRFKLFSFL